MKKFITFTLVGTLALLMLVGCGSNTENNNPDNQTITDNVNPSDTPTPSPTDEPTTTPTPSPTETPTPTPTETPTPTPEPHTHSYSESITKAATCTEVGEKTFTCECGEKYTENIPATGHQFNEYKSNNDATYTADGTETATCACGSTDTRTVKGSKLTYTYTELSATMYAKSAVNVRDLPSTDGNKLGGLSSGQAVTVTGKCNETGWYRIDYNGSVAYVSNSYLVDNKPVEPKPEEPTSGDPCNVPGLPFVPFQIYDEGDIVYYWYPSGTYEGYNYKEQRVACADECERIISARYNKYGFDTQYESYYYECSWGNTHKNGKSYICYDKFVYRKLD